MVVATIDPEEVVCSSNLLGALLAVNAPSPTNLILPTSEVE
ncbi:MAG: hypothetical protein N2B06_15550 [Clostridium sp.]